MSFRCKQAAQCENLLMYRVIKDLDMFQLECKQLRCLPGDWDGGDPFVGGGPGRKVNLCP